MIRLVSKAHLRKLSVELTPRDESHIENLDRVAQYIKNEFSQTTTLVKGGKMRYVPMPPELADELRRFTPQPANNVLYIAGSNHKRIFPPKKDAKGERQRVEGVLTIYSKEPGSKISVSMICVTRLHRGT